MILALALSGIETDIPSAFVKVFKYWQLRIAVSLDKGEAEIVPDHSNPLQRH